MDGRRHYREAGRLLICANSGGGNGSRQRGWKVQLQGLSEEIGMPITVCHPLSAGNQQVEQDRTSSILVHQPELEGQAIDQLRNGSQLDR